jgi:hypothetical protein
MYFNSVWYDWLTWGMYQARYHHVTCWPVILNQLYSDDIKSLGKFVCQVCRFRTRNLPFLIAWASCGTNVEKPREGRESLYFLRRPFLWINISLVLQQISTKLHNFIILSMTHLIVNSIFWLNKYLKNSLYRQLIHCFRGIISKYQGNIW